MVWVSDVLRRLKTGGNIDIDKIELFKRGHGVGFVKLRHGNKKSLTLCANHAIRIKIGNDEGGHFLLRAAASVVWVVGMIAEFSVVLRVGVGVDKESEVGHEEKLDLKRVHFTARHTSYFCIVGVVEILIVKELGSKHD